ncbi:hypothetical protein Tco_1398236, partial [Tanacetum coccineum]
GKVLIAGSKPHYFYRFSGTEFHTELRIEAFSPEYLLSEKASIRPIILELPEMISYGSGFDVVMTTELPVGIMEGLPECLLKPRPLQRKRVTRSRADIRELITHSLSRLRIAALPIANNSIEIKELMFLPAPASS